MQKSNLARTEWMWLAGLLFLVSLHFWFPRLNRGPSHDTYSTTAEGKKAFYLLARRWNERATRSSQPLPVLLENFYGVEKLCLLGPARYPTAAEWEKLLDWVAEGGMLLFAARSDLDEEANRVEIPGIGVSIVPNTGPFETQRVRTPLMEGGQLIWRSRGMIETSEGGAAVGSSPGNVLVQSGGTVQAVGVPHGAGYLLIVASDFVFSNSSLAWSDYSNAELAVRLLDETGPSTEVYFDESLNSSGTPKVVGLLFEPFLRPVTVQLLIGLLVFAWWRSRRFGPLLPRSTRSRHNIVDHTDTLGMLYFKGSDGARPVKSYLRQLERELRLGSTREARGPRPVGITEERALAAIAVRMGRETASLKKLFDRARRAAKAKGLDRKTAAKIIHRLALVRRAAAQPHPKPASSTSSNGD